MVRTIYDATVNFTPGAGNTGYTVTYTPLGGATVVSSASAPPVILGGLQPGGAYTITVTPICAGGGTAPAVTTTFNTALGTRTSLGSGNVTLFPNPAHHSFTLAVPALNDVRTATVEILNTLGQVVRQQALTLNATGTQAAVDIENLASGVYFVQLRAADQKAILRLIID